MTNDEYQRVAREQRRQQEAEEARRNSIQAYERQQREQRQRQEQADIEATSRKLGRVGAIPSASASILLLTVWASLRAEAIRPEQICSRRQRRGQSAITARLQRVCLPPMSNQLPVDRDVSSGPSRSAWPSALAVQRISQARDKVTRIPEKRQNLIGFHLRWRSGSGCKHPRTSRHARLAINGPCRVIRRRICPWCLCGLVCPGGYRSNPYLGGLPDRASRRTEHLCSSRLRLLNGNQVSSVIEPAVLLL